MRNADRFDRADIDIRTLDLPASGERNMRDTRALNLTLPLRCRAPGMGHEKLRIRDLRHSFASHAVMSGETLLTRSLLLGHRRSQTTFRHAHLADETLLSTAEKRGALIIRQASC